MPVEPTCYGDSRQCLKESSPTLLAPDVAITGNHLDVPRPGDNPNLLSPEILSQRRGMITVTGILQYCVFCSIGMSIAFQKIIHL
jgi:hypothetical protein